MGILLAEINKNSTPYDYEPDEIISLLKNFGFAHGLVKIKTEKEAERQLLFLARTLN